ncbi:hypothetical protein JCM11251_000096 [Rhodosporidiobolus azoricus]
MASVTRFQCSCRLHHPAPPQRQPPRSSSSIRFSSALAPSPAPRPRPREDPRWPGWTPTIGLELHVQLKGNPKLFSPTRGVYDAEPNKHVAHFDAALPGSLPVLHPPTLRLALLSSLALNCQINRNSTFDRKHYFYPDLPSGWQVTQKYSPLAKDGLVRVRLDTNTTSSASKKKKKGKKADEDAPDFVDVRIEQVQLEQDTAKSFHDPSLPPSGGTLVDLNRAGTALIEIVTRPDMHTPEEAGAFVRTLQRILRFVGGSNAGMEKGELRCDVNVSVARTGSTERGTRCEVKNLNGVKFVMGAIESEITRQISLLTSFPPLPVLQSTLGYSPLTHRTHILRSKESALDYRYMPDPELGIVKVTEEVLERLRREVPELPDQAFERLMREPYELSKRDAGIVVALGETDADGVESMEGEAGQGEEEEGVTAGGAAIGVRWFEEVVEALTFGEGEGAVKERARQAGNWLINDLLGLLSRHSLALSRSPVSPREIAELIDAVRGGRITGTNAKQVLREYIAANAPPSSSSSTTSSPTAAASLPSSPPSSSPPTLNGTTSFSSFLAPHLSSPPSSSSTSPSSSSSSSSDPSSSSPSSSSSDLLPLIHQVIHALPLESAKFRAGHEKVLMRLVGEAMKRSRGKVDPERVREGLRRELLGEGEETGEGK